MQVRSKHVGALVGLGVGWLIVQYGLIAAVFVLALAAAGWAVGRVLDGEIDVSRYVHRSDSQDLE
jgi:uncharacterized membrane protein